MKRWFEPRTAALAGLAVALLVGGVVVGALLRGDPVDRLAPPGALMEIHLADGSVYLGDLTSQTDDYLELAGPAVVVAGAAEGDAATYRVIPLAEDPYFVVGPALLSREQVTLVGAVAAGSSVERAYQDAMAEGAPESSPGT